MSDIFQRQDAEARRLLGVGFRQLSRQERRVIETVIQRASASHVTAAPSPRRPFGQRLVERIAAVGGSWDFIIGFCVVLVLWIGGVSLMLSSLSLQPLAANPYALLNLVLSAVAAAQMSVILISQRHHAAEDRAAARQDHELNRKAELEILELHEKLDAVRSRELTDLLSQQVALLQELRERSDHAQAA